MAAPNIQPNRSAEQLAKTADKALETAGGNRVEAARLLTVAVGRNPQLYRALMEPWVKKAAWEYIRLTAVRNRQAFWSAAERKARDEADRETAHKEAIGRRAMAEETARSILDNYLLPNGKALGDATREDLEAAIELHRMQVSAGQRNMRLYTLILDRMGGASCVRDALDDAAVEGLLAEVAHADK